MSGPVVPSEVRYDRIPRDPVVQAYVEADTDRSLPQPTPAKRGSQAPCWTFASWDVRRLRGPGKTTYIYIYMQNDPQRQDDNSVLGKKTSR